MVQEKALIYCRTAHPDTVTLEMQKEHLLAYAAAQGFAVVGVISESGSGLDYSRKGLREALALAENGEANVLLVKSLCRLGRNIEKSDVLLHRLKEKNIKVICADDGAEPQTSLKLFNSLLQHYRSSI